MPTVGLLPFDIWVAIVQRLLFGRYPGIKTLALTQLAELIKVNLLQTYRARALVLPVRSLSFLQKLAGNRLHGLLS